MAQKLTENLEYWMTNLPDELRTTSIIYLAIPGSHDSFTSSITSKSPISPDAEDFVRKLKWMGRFLGHFVSKWSRTQKYNVTEQLNSGVRYFDLRIATKTGTDQLFFVHGLYSNDVGQVLNEVSDFLNRHSQEVVILDCQHFYAFTQADHERLIRFLTSTFAHKLLPYSSHMDHLSLDYLTTQFRYQVIAIYRSDAARFGQPLLWPSNCFPTPWPNTTSMNYLFSFLDTGIAERNDNFGMISQCLLTPDSWFVVKHFFSTLKSKCVVPLEKPKDQWLAKIRPGKGGVNIIIADFVDIETNDFCKKVISLNYKLLGSPTHSVSKMRDGTLTPLDI